MTNNIYIMTGSKFIFTEALTRNIPCIQKCLNINYVM